MIAANYRISDGIGNAISARPLPVLFDRVELKLSTPLQRNKIYTVTSVATVDCAGNPILNNNIARVGLYERLDSLDIVVNEILFNPITGGNRLGRDL